MKLTYSKKILILAIIFLVTIFILDIVFTELLLGKIMDINNKVKQQEISSQARLKELTLRDSIDGSQVEREKLLSYFVSPGNAATVEFTKYLEDLSAEFQVTQKKTLAYEAIGEMGNSETVSAIRYNFNISGSWNNVYNFVRAIENLPKVVTLNSVSIVMNPDVVSVEGVKASVRTWSADLDFIVVKLK